MDQSDRSVKDVVGLRAAWDQPLSWHRAGDLPAAVGDLVVALLDGAEVVAEVVVGRGQCLAYPGDPDELPQLLRPAGPAEQPVPRPTAGQRLLASLD